MLVCTSLGCVDGVSETVAESVLINLVKYPLPKHGSKEEGWFVFHDLT